MNTKRPFPLDGTQGYNEGVSAPKIPAMGYSDQQANQGPYGYGFGSSQDQTASQYGYGNANTTAPDYNIGTGFAPGQNQSQSRAPTQRIASSYQYGPGQGQPPPRTPKEIISSELQQGASKAGPDKLCTSQNSEMAGSQEGFVQRETVFAENKNLGFGKEKDYSEEVGFGSGDNSQWEMGQGPDFSANQTPRFGKPKRGKQASHSPSAGMNTGKNQAGKKDQNQSSSFGGHMGARGQNLLAQTSTQEQGQKQTFGPEMSSAFGQMSELGEGAMEYAGEERFAMGQSFGWEGGQNFGGEKTGNVMGYSGQIENTVEESFGMGPSFGRGAGQTFRGQKRGRGNNLGGQIKNTYDESFGKAQSFGRGRGQNLGNQSVGKIKNFGEEVENTNEGFGIPSYGQGRGRTFDSQKVGKPKNAGGQLGSSYGDSFGMTQSFGQGRGQSFGGHMMGEGNSFGGQSEHENFGMTQSFGGGGGQMLGKANNFGGQLEYADEESFNLSQSFGQGRGHEFGGQNMGKAKSFGGGNQSLEAKRGGPGYSRGERGHSRGERGYSRGERGYSRGERGYSRGERGYSRGNRGNANSGRGRGRGGQLGQEWGGQAEGGFDSAGQTDSQKFRGGPAFGGSNRGRASYGRGVGSGDGNRGGFGWGGNFGGGADSQFSDFGESNADANAGALPAPIGSRGGSSGGRGRGNPGGRQNSGRGGAMSFGRGRPNTGSGGGGSGAGGENVADVSSSLMSLVSGAQTVQPTSRTNANGNSMKKPVSLLDLVFTPSQNRIVFEFESTNNPQRARLQQFKDFLSRFPERINAIQTIINAITASRLNVTADFETEHLMTVIKPLFTGRLCLSGTFLTRGLGLSKKAVKHDCFTRGLEILKTKTVDEILALEDCGVDALKDEVFRQSKDDYNAFKAFLYEKHASESDTSEQIRTAAISTVKSTGWHFPLADKIMMLVKEMNKPGMENAPIISRFDVTCFKVGITVTAIYRSERPASEDGDNLPQTEPAQHQDIQILCDIYFDDTLVGHSSGMTRRDAQKEAYLNLQKRLESESYASIAEGPKIPDNPSTFPDFLDVICKGARPQEGDNSYKLNLMKLTPPDPNATAEDIVVIETEGDNLEENAFKIMEFSATKGGLLLQWRQLDKGNAPGSFRCEMSLQRTKSAIGVATSKPKSRNAAAAQLLVEMYQNNDVMKFFPPTNDEGQITFKDIQERAQELKADGPCRPDRVLVDFLAGDDSKVEEKGKPNKSGSGSRASTSQKVEAPGENLVTEEAGDGADPQLEQWLADELRPWIEDAIVERMEKLASKLTLEELVFEKDLPRPVRKFAMAAAHKEYLVTGIRGSHEQGFCLTVRHRALTPQEMVKILHVNKGKSGRYQLIFANKPFTAIQQADFVRNFPTFHRERAKSLVEKIVKTRREAGRGDNKDESEGE